jgi:hypothetical protein
MIQFRCDTCGAYLRAGNSLAGKAFACATCGAKVVVPEVDLPADAVLDEGVAAAEEAPGAPNRKQPGDDWWSNVPQPPPDPAITPAARELSEAEALGVSARGESTQKKEDKPEKSADPEKPARRQPRTKLGAIFPDLDDPLKRKAIFPGAALALVALLGMLLTVPCAPVLMWSYFQVLTGSPGVDGCAVGLSVLLLMFSGIYYVMLLVRSIHMLLLTDREQAMIAAGMAMIPCSPCFLLGLPVGLWAMNAMRDEQVRKLFKH